MELRPLSAFFLEMLDATNTLGACLLLCEVSQKSIRRISRICTKRAEIMHELNTVLNADKFLTLWMFPKHFYHSFVLLMTLIHSTTG